MAVLYQAVENRKNHLINQLMNYGYFKTPEGKQLYELTLTELELTHIEVKCKFGKEMKQYE
ncbi:Fur-regulated basic protein FbpA [Priestia abyssalis]|uniref:Fur-regulated basic protein FbpA n=1 Tax=Priestia abyssalis TaxID=1221450 RepID=UPI0011161788|nr:Fur-regulated basic protein FbpA [Priestia abyssalis]